jgi:uncharacterized protein YcfL
MNRIAASLSVMALMIAAGCEPAAPINGRNDPYSARQIQFTSTDLQNETAVSAPILARDPSGYLKVQVPIRDTINQDLIVDYQTRYFDASGAVIETKEWHTVTLPANTPYSVQDTSTSPAAANFEMVFRYAK